MEKFKGEINGVEYTNREEFVKALVDITDTSNLDIKCSTENVKENSTQQNSLDPAEFILGFKEEYTDEGALKKTPRDKYTAQIEKVNDILDSITPDQYDSLVNVYNEIQNEKADIEKLSSKCNSDIDGLIDRIHELQVSIDNCQLKLNKKNDLADAVLSYNANLEVISNMVKNECNKRNIDLNSKKTPAKNDTDDFDIDLTEGFDKLLNLMKSWYIKSDIDRLNRF